MAKITSLRRLLLPCFTTNARSSTPSAVATTPKKRLSTSLRDFPGEETTTTTKTRKPHRPTTDPTEDLSSSFSSSSSSSRASNDSVLNIPHVIAPPRPSKSMVVCTFFGPRRSHVWFCVQIDRLSTRPSLLLELSISTQNLIREMRSGLVRIALECASSDVGPCPLRSVPVWTMYCNGRPLGFASRRKASEETRLVLKRMQSTTIGAGVIPSDSRSGGHGDEIMYMRANYDWLVGGADSESFHLINLDDDCPDQELSVFLIRSR